MKGQQIADMMRLVMLGAFDVVLVTVEIIKQTPPLGIIGLAVMIVSFIFGYLLYQYKLDWEST